MNMASTTEQTIADMTEAPIRINEFRRIIRVFFSMKVAVIGFVLVMIFIIMAIFAPLIAPYNPYAIQTSQQLRAPSASHLLGTDTLGRDILSRIIYGARTSLIIAVFSIVIGSLIGQILGLVAAYYRRQVYTIIMRVIDAQMAFPYMVLMIVIASMLGGGLRNVIIALSVSMIPISCRLMCGEALSIMQNDYIMAERSMGSSNLRIMLRHVYPNCLPTLIVLMTIQMGVVILGEAGMSFLGIGIQPPTAAWGTMVAEGYHYLLAIPVLAIAPGIAVMLLVFGFNMMGDGLRDALDPRLRGLV
jgi:ABC-type dipeptide/oligopeptide/nickel transport system permease subunit